MVVGTKSDLVNNDTREISIDEAVEFSKEINKHIDLTKLKGDPYFETSAKTGYNVSNVFEYLFSYCLPLDEALQRPPNEKSTVQLSGGQNSAKKSSCC